MRGIIYITAAICGLLFPLLDSFALKVSKNYQKLDKTYNNRYVRDYRGVPAWFHVIASLVPILNIFWIIVIILFIRFFIKNWWYARKKAFIWWLAGTKVNKHFKFKKKLVDRFFPQFKEYYWKSMAKRHWNYNMVKDIILKAAINAVATARAEQIIDRIANPLKDEKTKQNGPESKG
jgi:hypothetical protein